MAERGKKKVWMNPPGGPQDTIEVAPRLWPVGDGREKIKLHIPLPLSDTRRTGRQALWRSQTGVFAQSFAFLGVSCAVRSSYEVLLIWG